MKKIKVLITTTLVASLLGITSFAAVTTTPKGVQKLDTADSVDALNNNADVLDGHIDKIAGTDVFGHIKIGSGLQVSEDGVAKVKIANDLTTNDSETALSAAMGKELSDSSSKYTMVSLECTNLDAADTSLGGYQATLDTSSLIDDKTLAIVPLGCFQTDNSFVVGAMTPIAADWVKSPMWRINGSTSNKYTCVFLKIYHD